jgi:TetR/AcrR family transcriptional regulator, fatty acid metabolism regulator protein
VNECHQVNAHHRRRDHDWQRTCPEVLRAAEEVFARKGFHRASMEEIAKVAGHTTEVLYRYFDSEEVLYTAVLEQKIRKLLAFIMEKTGPSLDPVETLRLSVQAELEFASKNRAFIQIYYRERMEVTRAGEHWERIDCLLQELTQWRANGVALGQKHGVFRKGEPRLFVLALEGMMNGLVRDWITRETSSPMESHAQFIFQLTLQGILTNS